MFRFAIPYEYVELTELLVFLVKIGIPLLILRAFLRWALMFLAGYQPHPNDHILRWNGLIENLREAPPAFYGRFNDLLRAKLERPDLPFSKLRFGPKKLLGRYSPWCMLFGPRPVYLQVNYDCLTYYVFASPAPDGLYVTSWAFTRYHEWIRSRLLYALHLKRRPRETLFERDVALMFTDLMHRTLIEVADSYCAEFGLRPLDIEERRPVMLEFYASSSHLSSGPSVSLRGGSGILGLSGIATEAVTAEGGGMSGRVQPNPSGPAPRQNSTSASTYSNLGVPKSGASNPASASPNKPAPTTPPTQS